MDEYEEALTVQQLIDELEKVPDKTKKVAFDHPQKRWVEWVCAVYDDTWANPKTNEAEWYGDDVLENDPDWENYSDRVKERLSNSVKIVALSDLS